MVETGSGIDAQDLKVQIDVWLSGIKPFPREWVTGEGDREVFVEGQTVEALEPDDPNSKTSFFVSPKGIFRVEQDEVGVTDLSSAREANAADYVLYEKVIRNAIIDAQRNLSYGKAL